MKKSSGRGRDGIFRRPARPSLRITVGFGSDVPLRRHDRVGRGRHRCTTRCDDPDQLDLHNTLWVPAHFHTYLLEGVFLFIVGWLFVSLEQRSGALSPLIVRWSRSGNLRRRGPLLAGLLHRRRTRRSASLRNRTGAWSAHGEPRDGRSAHSRCWFDRRSGRSISPSASSGIGGARVKSRRIWAWAILAATIVFALAPLYRSGDVSIPMHHLLHVVMLAGWCFRRYCSRRRRHSSEGKRLGS